ncbi:MAG: DEAD/DEAH box helicase, partial [Tissierellia bacterium]|nr:DEAD/DEAH box helicase [Tissierellia bacterium]
NELTGFKDSKIWNMLYNFQEDAALAIINKLEEYNGCILADSVGLGKTFTALAVVKYYENRNKSVLVLCPKKLAENWNTYRSNYVNNILSEDRLRYDVLFHTDLSRETGESNGIDLERINWGNYDLVVIDESHNFRNGGQLYGDDDDKRENRYLRLLNKVIRQGVKTKVLMLSATPVNNKFLDLRNQLALSYEGESRKLQEKLKMEKTIDDVFKSAQRAFNVWADFEPANRTTKKLLSMLDFDFFKILDNVTIARSRKHIERYYDTKEIGSFPERLKPISIREGLTDLESAVNYNDIYDILTSLNLTIYTPSLYILPSRLDKYENRTGIKGENLTQSGREKGVQKLMSINLLKRLESSVHSFKLTLLKIKDYIDSTIEIIENFDGHASLDLSEIQSGDNFDFDDQNTDYFTVGRKIKVDLEDMDYMSWYRELKKDAEYLELLASMIEDIEPKYDNKLKKLLKMIDNKISNPINQGNKKILIFTAFSDTAEYLYQHVSSHVLGKHGLNSALITGSVDGRTTLKNFKADMNRILTCFSPISKDKDTLLPDENKEVDILIATDCISEGQNLQDCDYLINYDIHWNPVRIIQRFGRIDRIGSKNSQIQLVNFWPDMDLDEYINLKSRVETKMKISVMTSTGDDDPINQDEKGDLEYRRAQLERLKEEVVDLEDISGGISIMDLGLNDFRLDLLSYLDKYKRPEAIPMGIHSVTSSQLDIEPGVIFVLKNINDNVNKNHQNRL